MDHLVPVLELLEQKEVATDTDNVKVYKNSFRTHEGVSLLMIKDSSKKFLLAAGSGSLFDELEGEKVTEQGKVCDLTHENRLVLNQYFEFTKPRAFGKEIATIGLGDRLGLASPGHIQTVKER